jgi:hypothetical protein
MPKELLNGVKVGSCFDQPRGKGMTTRMEANLQPRIFNPAVESKFIDCPENIMLPVNWTGV